MRPAINLIMIFINKLEADVTQLNTIFYNLNKKKSTNKKFIEELSSDEASEKNLNKESNEEPLR